MAENRWYIFAEKHWYTVAERGWHTIAENRWYTYGRKLTTPAFAEFFPVSEKVASEILSPAGWRSMTTEDVAAHGTSLGQLFESMEQ